MNKNRHFRPHGRSYGNGNSRGGGRLRSFNPRAVVPGGGEAQEEAIVIKHGFSDFGLDRRIVANIAGRGFLAPTPVQDRAIPEAMKGKDLVGVAGTGTGKTAAFLLPLIDKALRDREFKTLIVAPTRELATQIEGELRSFSGGMGVLSVVCIGGVSLRRQTDMLRRRPNFVIGTPGRLLDLSRQRRVDFAKMRAVVLDEMDRMLDMGFVNDVESIISMLPEKRQSLFFSATLDPKVKTVMGKFIKDPVVVSIDSNGARGVHQSIVEVKGRNKTELLCEILKGAAKSLIFLRTKRGADNLFRTLGRARFQVAIIHGNKSQSQRQRSLDEFRRGRVSVLIATDVAARGIDVNDITHVINYDLPESYEGYIHRIGRTGRAGKTGKAITFV